MKYITLLCLFVLSLMALSAQAQEVPATQGKESAQNTETAQPQADTMTAFTAYTKWRDDSLRKYAQGAVTPHFALAVVAQRLDNFTAQIDLLIAADMKQYTISVRPVTLAKQPSGEYVATPVSKAVTINQKAGRKLTQGADAIRIGDMSTLVPVTRATQALEISWTPKNDKEEQANTCIVRLSKEPAVMVNGYILGDLIK